MILTFIDEGASAVISFCIRSEIPGYMVVPPDCRMLVYQHEDGREYTHHDNVAIEILPHINIAFHDGIESSDVNTAALQAKNAGLEESLRSTESRKGQDKVRKRYVLIRLRSFGTNRSFPIVIT